MNLFRRMKTKDRMKDNLLPIIPQTFFKNRISNYNPEPSLLFDEKHLITPHKLIIIEIH